MRRRRSVLARRASSGVAIASRSRRCSSRCRPTIASSVSSVMPLVTFDRREAELAEQRARLRALELDLERGAPVRRLGGRAGRPPRRRSRSAIACEQRQLRLALAVLDERELAAGDADRSPSWSSVRPRAPLSDGCGGRGSTRSGERGSHSLRIAKEFAILDDRDCVGKWPVPDAQSGDTTRRSGRSNRGGAPTMALADIFTRPRDRRHPSDQPVDARRSEPDPSSPAPPMARSRAWVDEIAALTKPDDDRLGATARAPRTRRCCASRSTRASSSSSTPSGAPAATSPAPTRATSPGSRTARSSARSARRTPAPRTTGATRRDARRAARRVRRLHEGPHDVRRAVLDGRRRRPDLAARRRDHRLAYVVPRWAS